ncbi:MAG: hypothetical protein ACOCTM_00490 [Bacteroidota bacterium]
MNKEDLIKYIENPRQLNEYSFSELRALVNKYPYFQTAHQLLLLNMKNINDPRFKEFLKQSAVYINKREKFYRLINDLSSVEESSEENMANGQPGITADGSEKETASKKSDGARSGEDQGKEEESKKKEKTGKEKDFSTAYLKQRIADTLSVQKGDNEKKEELADDSNDFFILDKASQVEKKISQRFKEQYENEKREEKEEEAEGEASGETDSFELDSNAKRKNKRSRDKPDDRNLSGEYFSGEDFRRAIQDKEENDDLIEQFLKGSPEPRSVHPPENSDKKDISVPSIRENEEMLSEKLVNIYIKQGYYHKAIGAYEKLSLKYPEKSDYFAEQIEKLRNSINEQQK